jgi:glycosyltransferase involved in cell wall biosynthesis
MRIALLTDGIYPYVIGGMQKHSFYLARNFARLGIAVDLYHFNASEKDMSQLELFTESERKMIHAVNIPFPDLGKSPGHYLRESLEYSKRIFKELDKREKVDYIYAKGFTAWHLLDEKRKGALFPPVGVNFHGYEMFQHAESLNSRFEQFLLRHPVRFNIKHADHVFSYGGKITELIHGQGVEYDKIIELPTGIESAWLNEKDTQVNQRRRFIFVGRNERRKGIEELNEVLKHWKGPQSFEFVIVGPIPVSKQIKKLGVSYKGNIDDQEEMKSLLQSSDILVCPSHSEGMPNVILESMASGLAVIATNVGAVPTLVDAHNGWLIKPGSTAALCRAMEDALSIPDEELIRRKKYSIDRVKGEFLWECLIEQTITKIKEKIGK